MNETMPEKDVQELYKEIKKIEGKIIFVSCFLSKKLNLILFLQILFKIISVFCLSGR